MCASVTNSYAGVVLGVYFSTFGVSCYFPFPLFFILTLHHRPRPSSSVVNVLEVPFRKVAPLLYFLSLLVNTPHYVAGMKKLNTQNTHLHTQRRTTKAAAAKKALSRAPPTKHTTTTLGEEAFSFFFIYVLATLDVGASVWVCGGLPIKFSKRGVKKSHTYDEAK